MRTFYIVWIGQLFSTIGSGLTGFGAGVWLYQETGSATLFALNTVAYTLPRIVLSPVAGVFADRYNRRWIMLISDFLAAVSTLLLGFLFLNGVLHYWHIYLISAINSAANTFQSPAYQSSTTLLVPKEKLGNANGLLQMGEALSQLIVPAVAGILFVATGLTTVVLLDLATFVIAIVTLSSVRFPQLKKPVVETAETEKFSQQLKVGWRYLLQRKGLMGLWFYIALLGLLGGMIGPLLFPLLLELTTPDKLGLLLSTMGIGMVAGTIVMSMWGGTKNRVVGIIGFAILGGFISMLLGIPSVWAVGVAGFLMMFTAPFLRSMNQTLWQIKVAPNVQGRVFALRDMLMWVTPAIAAILGGLLADYIFEPLLMEGGALSASVGKIMGTGAGRGTAFLFVLIGLAQIALSILAYMHPRIRNLESELPDEIADSEPENVKIATV